MLSELKTFDDCIKAIDMIEMDYVNTVGGYKAFFSGCNTTLTKSAINKISAINAKIDKLIPDEE